MAACKTTLKNSLLRLKWLSKMYLWRGRFGLLKYFPSPAMYPPAKPLVSRSALAAAQRLRRSSVYLGGLGDVLRLWAGAWSR